MRTFPSQGLRAIWNDLAAYDPLWAVLAFDEKRNRGWDVREFMKVGEREIALALLHSAQNGFSVPLGTALDFGCGVGRLTQAMARRFQQAVGVDISDEMIRLASGLNRYPDRAQYRLVDETGLVAFASGEFDFIYSVIVLQHIPTASAIGHIREFGRLLKPGGILVFQLPSHRVDPQAVETKPMADGGYRARVEIVDKDPIALKTSEPFHLAVSVTNTSPTDWIQLDLGSLRIGNHWLDRQGELMIHQDDGRSVMPMVVRAGTAFEADLVVTAPSTPGDYILEVDVVHEAVTWFAGRGSVVARRMVSVTEGGRHSDAATQLVELVVPEYPNLELPTGLPTAPPVDFPMFGVAKESVLETLRAAGLKIFNIEDDPRAGHDWISYLYFAAKPG